jgi:hypothetical protein
MQSGSLPKSVGATRRVRFANAIEGSFVSLSVPAYSAAVHWEKYRRIE